MIIKNIGKIIEMESNMKNNKIKRIWELVLYFFNFDRRRKNLYIKQKKEYFKQKIDDLEAELNHTKIIYGWNEDIYKMLSKIVAGIGIVAFVGFVSKVLLVFFNKSVIDLSIKNQKLAVGVAIIFLLSILLLSVIGLILYRKYINELKIKLDMMENILKKEKKNYMMNDDEIVSLGSRIFFEIVYLIYSIIYFFKLNNLNHILFNLNLKGAFEIISYNNKQPVYYVIGAIILLALSVILILSCFELARIENFSDIFLVLLLIVFILNIGVIVFVWVLINNPILRAFMIVCAIGFILLWGITQPS